MFLYFYLLKGNNKESVELFEYGPLIAKYDWDVKSTSVVLLNEIKANIYPPLNRLTALIARGIIK